MENPFWNILLIEDDEDDYILTKEWLNEAKQKNYHLVWTRSVEQGLAALHEADFDVILVDYDLGGKTGIDFVQEAVSEGCFAPLIVFSGRATYELDLLGMKAGATDFLNKAEVTPYLLERSIRYAIEQRRNKEELEWRVSERTRELREVVAALQDEISERKRTGQELKLSQERLRTVVSNAPVILWAVDPDGCITLVEGKGLSRLGVTREALIGQAISEYLEEFPALEAGKEFPQDLVIISSLISNPREILESHFTPQYGENGNLSGITGVSVIVTERVRAQEQLKYQAHLLENISDAVVAVNDRWECTEWNRAAETIYGWNASEMLGKPINEQLKTEFIGLTYDDVTRILNESNELHCEMTQTRKDGAKIWVENRSRVILGVKGQQAGIVSIIRDITERKRAEAKAIENVRRSAALAQLSQVLAEASHDYQRVLDRIAEQVAIAFGDSCAIAIVSSDGKELEPISFFSNDLETMKYVLGTIGKLPLPVGSGIAGKVVETGKAVRLTNLNKDQLLALRPEYGANLYKVNISSLIVVPLRAHNRVFGTLSVFRASPENPYANDDQMFLQDLADRAALFINNAELFQEVQQELTERRKAEEALRSSEERLRKIIDESPLGIKLVDLDGTILSTNPAFQEMVGYQDQELRGKDISYLVVREDQATNWRLFKALAAGESDRFRFEARYCNRQNEIIWVRMVASLVRDEESAPLFVIKMVENITEQRQMEAELQEVNRQLMDSREAERLDLSQELHDGPMQSLYGVIFQMQNLQMEIEESTHRQALQTLMQQVTDTNQVLRIICGELRPPTLTPFGLERAIRSHADAFMEQNPGIHMILSLMPDHRLLPERIRLALFRIYQQAMANILRHAQADQVNVLFELDAEQILLKIQDNGKGFQVPRRWIDFVRAGHLGLAGIAERSDAIGGHLNVRSAPGNGTTIEIIVPQR